MKIKYWDYLKEYKENKKNYLKKIDKAILSKSLILGKEVKLFEKKASRYLGCKYGIGVNSGTDALVISLMALGIRKGDEIITTSNTAIPTISAIVTAGAKPVYVDINKNNYLINENLIERNVSKKTKAIIVVHLYGQSPDMQKILKICRKFKIKLIGIVLKVLELNTREKIRFVWAHLSFFFLSNKNFRHFWRWWIID